MVWSRFVLNCFILACLQLKLSSTPKVLGMERFWAQCSSSPRFFHQISHLTRCSGCSNRGSAAQNHQHQHYTLSKALSTTNLSLQMSKGCCLPSQCLISVWLGKRHDSLHPIPSQISRAIGKAITVCVLHANAKRLAFSALCAAGTWSDASSLTKQIKVSLHLRCTVFHMKFDCLDRLC